MKLRLRFYKGAFPHHETHPDINVQTETA